MPSPSSLIKDLAYEFTRGVTLAFARAGILALQLKGDKILL